MSHPKGMSLYRRLTQAIAGPKNLPGLPAAVSAPLVRSIEQARGLRTLPASMDCVQSGMWGDRDCSVLLAGIFPGFDTASTARNDQALRKPVLPWIPAIGTGRGSASCLTGSKSDDRRGVEDRRVGADSSGNSLFSCRARQASGHREACARGRISSH